MMDLNEEVAEAGQTEIVALGKDIRWVQLVLQKLRNAVTQNSFLVRYLQTILLLFRYVTVCEYDMTKIIYKYWILLTLLVAAYRSFCKTGWNWDHVSTLEKNKIFVVLHRFSSVVLTNIKATQLNNKILFKKKKISK